MDQVKFYSETILKNQYSEYWSSQISSGGAYLFAKIEARGAYCLHTGAAYKNKFSLDGPNRVHFMSRSQLVW